MTREHLWTLLALAMVAFAAGTSGVFLLVRPIADRGHRSLRYIAHTVVFSAAASLSIFAALRIAP